MVSTRRRRLSGLLLERDSDKFSRYKHVRVVFLPHCTAQDIRELEARLQVVPDTRADYTWVDLAMMHRNLREGGATDESIAAIYGSKPSEIRENIRMLSAAEAYLESRGWSGQYSRISKHGRYAFSKLIKGREALGDEAARDAFTGLGYILIDDPTGGRLYDSIPDLQTNLDEVVAAVTAAFPEAQPLPESGEEDDGLLGPDPQDAEAARYSGVVAYLSRQTEYEPVRQVMQDVIEEAQRRERERKDAQYCLRQLVTAHTALVRANTCLDDAAQTDGLAQQLDQIEAAAATLRGKLDALGST